MRHGAGGGDGWNGLNQRLRYISREPEGSPCRAGVKEIDGGPVRVYSLHIVYMLWKWLADFLMAQ